MINKKQYLSKLHNHGHGHAWLALLLLLLIQISPPVTAQSVAPEVEVDNNKSVATIMGIVALMFLVSGFLSLYSGKCSDRQGNRLELTLPTGGSGRRSPNEARSGLNQYIIDTFPTFLYSNVKGLKIGKGTLACAVCLNEFQDEETLRMIPKCSHVYHPICIDAWLASHITCPLCRANLVPRPEDTTTTTLPPITVSIEMPEDHELHTNDEEEQQPAVGDTIEDQKRDSDVESPKVDLLHRCRTTNQCFSTRSRSTGFLSSLLFPRSNSMGLGQPSENCERFTLRLPDEVRSQMIKSTTLKRANSCVNFTRMSSGTWGYRTRSVGNGRGRDYVQYERFGIGIGSEEQLGFSLTPTNFFRNGWNRSMRKSPVRCSGLSLGLDNNVGERSSDLLCPT